MSPYLALGIIIGCIASCAAFVAVLALAGVPVYLSLLSVYGVSIISLYVMQKRACGELEPVRHRYTPRARATATAGSRA